MIPIAVIVILSLLGVGVFVGLCTFISNVCFPKLSRSICDLFQNGCCYVIHTCNHCDEHLNDVCFPSTKHENEKHENV